MRQPEVRLLHAEGCPSGNTEAARTALGAALVRVGMPVDAFETVLIKTQEEALAHGFVGGPAIMVDGVDADPAVREMRAGGLGCRAYISADGISGAPSVELIEAALREARG